MGKYYKYTLAEDYIHPVLINAPDAEYEWASLKRGVLTIKKGYFWNGCSPKISVFDLFVIGTPEGIIDYRTGKPITYYASLVHDCMYQYCIGSKKLADDEFLRGMEEVGFRLAKQYYGVVDKFGNKQF